MGREDNLRRFTAALTSGCRLISLFGPVGVGKTRLLAALDEQGAFSSFGASCWYLDLFNVDSAEDLNLALARTLNQEPRLGGPEETRAEALDAALLGFGTACIVLDHGDAALEWLSPRVLSWLDRCPGLHVVLCAQQRFRVRGQVAHALGPLDRSAAVELFLKRASETRDDFSVPEEQKVLVAQLVDQLDRLPLAIELAAEQTSVLSLPALAAKLESEAPNLDAPLHNAPHRHHTLRAALELSLRRLTAEERLGLVGCAAFAGEFTVATAQAILVKPSGADVCSVLRRLCDKSWLSVLRKSPSEETVFRLFSTTRQFIASHPVAAKAYADAQRRHADHFTQLAEEPRAELLLPQARALSATEQAQLQELLAVAERALGENGATLGFEDALRSLAACVVRLGAPAAPRALALLNRYLSQQPDASPELVALLLFWRGRLNLKAARWALAKPDFERVLQVTANADLRAAASCALGNTEREQGQPSAAEGHYRRAEAELLNRPLPRAMVLARLGGLYYEQGQLDQAIALHEAALEGCGLAGDPQSRARVLHNMALIVQEQGEFGRAVQMFSEALTSHRRDGDLRSEAIASFDLAGVALEQGTWSAGRQHASAALEGFRVVSERRLAALAYSRRAACEASLGRLEESRADLAEAERIIASMEDQVFRPVVEIDAGHWEIMASLRSELTDSAPQAERWLARAQERIARITLELSPRLRSDELRLSVRALNAALARRRAYGEALLVASDYTWLRGPGQDRTDLRSKLILRRLLGRLIESRLSQPGASVSREALLDAGWPGERISAQAANNRLHVYLSHLRRAGLGSILVRDVTAYRLEPSVPLHIVHVGASAPES